MPYYTYTCPCGRKFDLRSTVSDRDRQTCDGSLAGCTNTQASEQPCKLTREEIPEQGAAASYNWSKWAR